ncbi:fatty acid desaturase [Sulfitobacter sp. SK012]|nr:fatty acid desaturase [Sulfitobacter sp. SK012]
MCDWPTLALFFGTATVWAMALMLPAGWGLLAVVGLVLALTLHSSLSHEILHGHPFRSARAGTALGLFQPGLLVPYLRFKRLHLAHHRDANLTDPYDDPESNYLDPAVWHRLPFVLQMVLGFNNTLLGRIVIGPLVGMVYFLIGEVRLARAGDPHVMRDWRWHLPGVVLSLWLVSLSVLPLWAYLVACYGALSVLKIRTFMEHRAHEHAAGRTVIIEDRGLLAFLFLNNNLHVVHHMHPDVSWYRLPALYAARRVRFRARNDGYIYASYAQLFRSYFLRAKDPVAHPLWRED